MNTNWVYVLTGLLAILYLTDIARVWYVEKMHKRINALAVTRFKELEVRLAWELYFSYENAELTAREAFYQAKSEILKVEPIDDESIRFLDLCIEQSIKNVNGLQKSLSNKIDFKLINVRRLQWHAHIKKITK
jgi:hypothetical protein